MKQNEFFLYVSRLPARERRYLSLLLEQHFLEELYHDPSILKLLPHVEQFINDTSQQAELTETLERWSNRGVKFLNFTSEQYPAQLKRIDDAPLLLYYLGELTENFWKRDAIAIVGSRNSDRTGLTIAQELATELAKRGLLVVSGLALGIDAAAHRGALDSSIQGCTVAILGNALPEISPATNKRLGLNIIEQGGLVISQFEPGTETFPGNFINRNRVISGLSFGTVVVQARDKSGSLVTARFALEQGREVYAVPGAITDRRFKGSNQILKQGATLVTSVEDILENLPQHIQIQRPAETKPDQIDLSREQRLVVEALSECGELERKTLADKVSITDLDSILLDLELDDIIIQLPGNKIALKSAF